MQYAFEGFVRIAEKENAKIHHAATCPRVTLCSIDSSSAHGRPVLHATFRQSHGAAGFGIYTEAISSQYNVRGRSTTLDVINIR